MYLYLLHRAQVAALLWWGGGGVVADSGAVEEVVHAPQRSPRHCDGAVSLHAARVSGRHALCPQQLRLSWTMQDKGDCRISWGGGDDRRCQGEWGNS